MYNTLSKKYKSYQLLGEVSFADKLKFYRFKNNKSVANNKYMDHLKQESCYSVDTLKLTSKNIFNRTPRSVVKMHQKKILAISDRLMRHEFAVFSTDWKKHTRRDNSRSDDFLSQSSVEHMQKLSRLITENYQPIAWSRDIKTEYLWPRSQISTQALSKSKINSDIKNIWELTRFYHLPTLAYSYRLSNDKKYLIEGCNQILDFMCECPPNYGPNWFNAMEVSIRALNFIVFFEQAGEENFSIEFKQAFANIISDHFNFILRNLEWTLIARSNHYLANLLGLLVVLHKISRDRDQENLLHWIEKEIFHEFNYQFLHDGGNFEGSTGYHKLSCEIMFLAVNIINNSARANSVNYKSFVKKNIFSLPHFANSKYSLNTIKDKFNRANKFLRDISVKDKFEQVGDNDSGRILRLSFCDQNTDLMSVLPVLNYNSPTNNSIESTLFDKKIIQDNILTNKFINRVSACQILNESYKYTNTYQWKLESFKFESMSHHCYDDFGLYIIKAKEFYLSLRSGSQSGQNGVGGHNHNDQLSISLYLNGSWLVQDPGSFVYTQDPELRNKYRSSHSHFVPRVQGHELSPLDQGMFILKQDYISECLIFNKNFILARHNAYGDFVYRAVEITDDGIQVSDFSHSVALEKLNIQDGKYINQVTPSSMYGVL